MKQNSITVKLDPNERKLITDFAYDIWTLKGSQKEFSHQNNYDLIGRAGEYAFAKYFNIVDSLNWDITLGKGDGGVDVILPGTRKTVNIKTTQYFNYPELKEHTRYYSHDLYVLVSFHPQRWTCYIEGFIHQAEFCTRKYYQKNYRGKGERYVMSFADLYPITQIYQV